MATVQIDVRPGPAGPMYLVSGTAGTTVTINDYLHPDSSTSGDTGAASAVTDAGGNRGKRVVKSL